MKNKKLPKLIVILGPTASGKTKLAIKLAKKFNGGIISADSRQIYSEMNIGTAKPTKKELKIIPSHLIDTVSPKEKFNVALYKNLALEAIEDIQKKGKIPFLVGGTGLYIQALVDNIEFPKVIPQKELRAKLEKKSVKELFEIYKKLDSKGAKFIESKNKRRLIRAIEVCKATKKPFWAQREKGKPIFDILEIGIKLPKNELKKRVEKRVEKMFKMGLEKEVKKIVKKYGFKIPPMQTIGYQEWIDFFERKINKNGVKERIILHTLQFARRQMTWFKKDKGIKWTKDYRKIGQLIKKFISK